MVLKLEIAGRSTSLPFSIIKLNENPNDAVGICNVVNQNIAFTRLDWGP